MKTIRTCANSYLVDAILQTHAINNESMKEIGWFEILRLLLVKQNKC